MMAGVELRRATERDAAAVALAHLDSIHAIGPSYYPHELVEAWAEGLTADVYTSAMRRGEVFFIATGDLDGHNIVLGFASHRIDDEEDGVSVYVRGCAARQGIGTALLRLAEEHARSKGVTSLCIQATLAGVEFWRANGFEDVGPVEAPLRSGRTIPCVSMRKRLT